VDAWLEHLVREIIWKAIQDEVGSLEAEGAALIESELAGLTAGQKLSSSPLVQVAAVDDASVTMLVRGRFKLFGGAVAPFIRIELRVSKTVDDQLDPPITILDWESVVGDLQITKAGVFSAELGFGYSDGAWLGRGAFKVVPAGFGLDLLLGGLDDRGLMVGIDLHLPAPIPLGSSGVVLIGVGGDFAYNFVPRLNHGVPKPGGWNATDYVLWAKDQNLDRWAPGPPDETAVGIGLHAGFGDLSTLGRMITLDPIGLAVLTPGPIFVLGGKGKLISTETITAEGYVAVDIPSGSIALGLDVQAIEKFGDFTLMEAKGSLDAFFSFQHPADWYIHLGTNTAPIKGKVFMALEADLFLMIGHAAVPAPDGTLRDDGIFFGIGLAYGGKWKWWIVEVVARIGARVAVALGWNPLELEGAFSIYGELGLKIWEFGFRIVLQTDLTGHLAKPTQLTGDLHFFLDLPWPIPNVEGTLAYSLGEADAAPDLKSPLLVGSGG
jgi:hypothetical protein